MGRTDHPCQVQCEPLFAVKEFRNLVGCPRRRVAICRMMEHCPIAQRAPYRPRKFQVIPVKENERKFKI
jgi:hypothetical protein